MVGHFFFTSDNESEGGDSKIWVIWVIKLRTLFASKFDNFWVKYFQKLMNGETFIRHCK